MSRLVKFLSWCFAGGAIVFGWIWLASLRNIPYFLHLGTAALHGREALVATWSVLLPPILAVLYAMAWWTTKRATAHARTWAIGASLANTLLGLAPVIVLWEVPDSAKLYASVAGLALPLLAIGIAGLIVFSRRDALSQKGAEAYHVPRRAGDGTSPLIDTVAQLVVFTAVLAGLVWTGRWGESQGLTPNAGLWFWVELLTADLVVAAVHEMGHATVGRALGMRLRAFNVGPFGWQIRNGKWTFQFRPANILAPTGGSAGLVPTRLTDALWLEGCMIAAGPVANLFLGVVALWATLAAKGQPWEPAWELLAFIALISLVSFAINLIPIRPEGRYSDGAYIYQLLTHSPWSDVHRVFLAVGSSLVTPLRPRDFDAEAIRRSAALVNTGQQGLLLRMYLFTHLLDCGQIPQALGALSEAEAVFEQSASDLPGELLAYFVYANAFLKFDPAQARHWWDLMEAKKPRQDCTEYWLALTSHFWVENDPEKALEAWQQGNALAQKQPKAGAYDFDRSLFLQLGQKLAAPFGAGSQAASMQVLQ